MKFHFRVILLVLGVSATVLFCACGRTRHVKPLDTEHLFIDLRKEQLARRAEMADRTFSGLRQSVGLNGVVLYAEGDDVIYRKAFGWRDLTRCKDLLRVDDQFQLASVSKMFTAEAVMLLHAQGKLDYDDTLTKYIPDFPYPGITIRHLLNHRSGLSRYETLADEHWPDRTVPLDNESMIDLYRRYHPEPYNQPDVTFHYSNINYALLATVVERASGQPFEEYLREHVFEPLGMDHTYVYSLRGVSSINTFVDTEVQGHDLLKQGARRAQEDYLNGVMGDKMVYSTVDDLYRFAYALDHQLLLPDSLQREAFVPGSPEWKRGENYGFGWRMHERHPGAVYHYGWWKGYRSFFVRDTVLHRTLIILTNTDSGALGEPLWDFIGDTTIRLPEVTPYRNQRSVLDH